MQLVHNRDWKEPLAQPVPQSLSQSVPPLALVEPDAGQSATTYSLLAIGRMLGVWKRSQGWIVRYVAQLIEEEDFPRPLPTLVKGRLTRDIQPRRSRWNAVAVQAWFRAQVPVHAVALVEDAVALEAAASAAGRLDANADNLFGAGR